MSRLGPCSSFSSTFFLPSPPYLAPILSLEAEDAGGNDDKDEDDDEDDGSTTPSVPVEASATSVVRWVCVPREALSGGESDCVPTVLVLRFFHRVLLVLCVLLALTFCGGPVPIASGRVVVVACVVGVVCVAVGAVAALSVWVYMSEVAAVIVVVANSPNSRRASLRSKLCIFSPDAVSFASRSRIAAAAVARAMAVSSSAAASTRCSRRSSLAVRTRTRAVVSNRVVADSNAL